MTALLAPDLCVIGADPGGLSLAMAAAALSAPTVLVEKDEPDSLRLNRGCAPSAALIAAANAAQTGRESGGFGISSGEMAVDMRRVRAHIHSVVEAAASNDSAARLAAMGVTVVRGAGKFVAKDMLEAGGVRIRARRFIIATGSSPSPPPIPGLDQIRYFTEETIFDLDDAPARLVIVGGGPAAMELAQAFRRLGSDVTVIAPARALAQEDAELAAVVFAALRAEGVVIREKIRILRIEALSAGARIVIDGPQGEEQTDCTHVLVAAGRTPNIRNLDLERAGVAYDGSGIAVGKGLRTSNRRIYAIGDAAQSASGQDAPRHASTHHAGLVLRSALFRLPVRLEPHLVPRLIHTDPEIAVAGLTEAQAREAHGPVNVYRWPLAESERGRAERATRGHIKIVATAKDAIVGAAIAGRHAGESIGLWQLAISKGMKVTDIADLPLPHPTLSEVSKRAAMTQYQKRFGHRYIGGLLRFLRRFG